MRPMILSAQSLLPTARAPQNLTLLPNPMKPTSPSGPVFLVNHPSSQADAAPDLRPDLSRAVGYPGIPLFVPAQDASASRRRARSPLHQQLLSQAQAQRSRTQPSSNTQAQSLGSDSYNGQAPVLQAHAGADPLDLLDEQSTSDDSISSTEFSSDTETQALGSASDRAQAPTLRAAAATNRRSFFGEDSSSEGSISSFLDALSNRVQSYRNVECVANWQTWAAAADAKPREQRATALNRVIEWVNIGDFDAKLDLSSLDLNSRLPALPQGLKHLNVSDNEKFGFTELPESVEKFLPESLETLDAHDSYIELLPQLSHTRLTYLNLFETQIREIPELPPTLIDLYAACCGQLSRIRTLPPNLRHLNLKSVNNRNPIELPPLPPNLISLDISNSYFVEFPQLPDSLEKLDAKLMGLDTLPDRLPVNLKSADFSENYIDSLPNVLPASLKKLYLGENEFVSVPQSIFSLSRRCTVEFYNNPIPADDWNDVVRITTQADYSGPRIKFNT